jgi:hypothetical protein
VCMKPCYRTRSHQGGTVLNTDEYPIIGGQGCTLVWILVILWPWQRFSIHFCPQVNAVTILLNGLWYCKIWVLTAVLLSYYVVM